MIAWLLSTFGSYLAWAAGAIGAVAGVYFAGRRDAARKAALRDAKGYQDTRKRIDETDTDGSDPAVLRDWLRSRDPDQR